jgi:uncharacterized repeat protein (TIGR03803 family)
MKIRPIVAALLACAVLGPVPGAASGGGLTLLQEHVIWTFKGSPSDGSDSTAAPIVDGNGALYGTTRAGGSGSCPGTPGCGAIYKLTPAGAGYTEAILYDFQGAPNDGEEPESSLIADKNGVLYGTTLVGGDASTCQLGCGTVFKLTPSGSGYMETIAYAFQGATDGEYPIGVIIDATGALYGTTEGGASGHGTVFKLTPTQSGYALTTLYAFQGGTSDGADPSSSLIVNKYGQLFGETGGGGQQGDGTVFKLTQSKSGFVESLVYSFQNGRDGADPGGGLFLNANGALFGMSEYGGARVCHCGAVFKLTPAQAGYRENTLHVFTGDRKDGKDPLSGVIGDAAGALYGTTYRGGADEHGVVFKLTPTGSGYTETILFNVGGRAGAGAAGGLLLDASGALYGATATGPLGTYSGTVFKITM